MTQHQALQRHACSSLAVGVPEGVTQWGHRAPYVTTGAALLHDSGGDVPLRPTCILSWPTAQASGENVGRLSTAPLGAAAITAPPTASVRCFSAAALEAALAAASSLAAWATLMETILVRGPHSLPEQAALTGGGEVLRESQCPLDPALTCTAVRSQLDMMRNCKVLISRNELGTEDFYGDDLARMPGSGGRFGWNKGR